MPWRQAGVEMVLECSGKFKTPATLQPYFDAGLPGDDCLVCSKLDVLCVMHFDSDRSAASRRSHAGRAMVVPDSFSVYQTTGPSAKAACQRLRSPSCERRSCRRVETRA